MNIRSRTTYLIMAAFACLIIAVFFISSTMTQDSLNRMEEDDLAHDVARMDSALSYDLGYLDASAADWAAWDDTYDFMADGNADYIATNLVDGTFDSLRLNLLVLVSPAGDVVGGGAYDLANGAPLPPPADLYQHIAPGSLLLSADGLDDAVKGVLQLEEGSLLVAARPILTSQGEGPARGTLLMGRYLGDNDITDLANIAGVELTTYRYGAADLPADVRAVQAELSDATPVIVRGVGDDTIAGYTVIHDIYGAPALLCKVEEPRQATTMATRGLSISLVSIIAVGLVLALIMSWAINRWVLARLDKLGAELVSIGVSDDLSRRVMVLKQDEVGALAGNINKTLAALETAQQGRLKMEAALREAETKYRTLVEESNDGIVFIRDGVLVFASAQMQKLIGCTPEELQGRPFVDFIAPEDRELAADRYRRRLAGEAVPSKYDITLVGKNGRKLPVEISARVVEYEGARMDIGIIRDITDRKQLEAEQQKMAKLESLGVLAGGIAHDFNNALTGILGNIQMGNAYLERGEAAAAREVLTEAEQASLRARALTQQLFTFSRGGAPVKKVIRLERLIRESARFLLRGSNSYPLFVIPADLWAVEADEGQLSQVISNLVINADQAMPNGGTIDISARNTVLRREQVLPLPPGDYVMFTVQDHGKGIAPEHQAKIFDPYFTTKKQGSGLGLTTAYSIVKNHGGHITFETEADAGTSFHVYLPAVREAVIPEGPETPAALMPSSHGKLLVMDDEETIRQLLGRMLALAGYTAELVEDGAAAVQKYIEARQAGQPFDAVILDLMVPGAMGGAEVLKKLRGIDPGVKAIVSSGYATDPIMAKYKEYGFAAVVTKPYNINDIQKVLREVVG